MAYSGAFEYGAAPWLGFFGRQANIQTPSNMSSQKNCSSPYYSGSNESINSFPSLFNGVLQAVGGDQYGYNDSFQLPALDLFKGFGYRDCNCFDSMCDTCCNKIRYQPTRPAHSLSPDYFGSPPTSAGTPSPPLQIYHTSPPSPRINLCTRHTEKSNCYCQTCNVTFCGECDFSPHLRHVTVYLNEALENAKVQATQVISDAALGIKNLSDDIEEVASAVVALDAKSKQASDDVSSCVKRLIMALEDREKKLLMDIENARLLKLASLKSRNEVLRNNMLILKDIAEKLGRSITTSKMSANPTELYITKDQAAAEIYKIRKAHSLFAPLEETWISFGGPDGIIFDVIGKLGAITIINPGPIGDRRAVKGRNATQPTTTVVPKIVSRVPVPHGRPILGNNFPVTIWTERHSVAARLTQVRSFGSNCHPNEKLCRPWGVACDREGNIIVADRSNNRIQVFREDGSLVRIFGTRGTHDGEFDRPAGIAVDAYQRLVIADKDNHRIQVFTLEGVWIRTIGERGSKDGQFNYPWDVAVNSECQIVVSDTRNHRVQLFSPQGVFLRKFGNDSLSNMWKILDSPRGVAFAPTGEVIVTDFNNHKIIAIEPDFTSAKALGDEKSKIFCRPQGLVIDDQGNMVVADSRNHRIQVLSREGTIRRRYGTHGTGVDEMDRPSGLALLPNGRIVCVDFGNNRVVII